MADVGTPAPLDDLRRRLAALDELPAAPASNVRSQYRDVRNRVVAEASAMFDRGLDDAQREEQVRHLLDRILEEEDVQVSPTERRGFVRQILSETFGLGPLDDLLIDDSITEIMCNGPDKVYVERNGRIELIDLTFADEAQLRAVINRIARASGRRIDESSPMVDARMADGSRMNAVLPPLALNGPVLTIRRFPSERLTPDALVAMGTYTPELMQMLSECVRSRRNIVVSGGTSSGKTTALNVLSSFIDEKERIVTIEDSAELTMQQPHVITLEARPPNAEGEGEVTIRDLVRNALRMRPDRLVIGECRAGEALDMLQAMNTGHEGSLTTVHANSARDALRRLETMVLMAGFDLPVRAIRDQMASTIQLVLQLERQPNGRRAVKSLTEVYGIEDDTIHFQDLFVLDPATNKLRVAAVPTFQKLLDDDKAQHTEPVPAATDGSEGRSR